ncbi:MAG: site-specific DNA-methyltransferase, partial [Spirochaetales bacterium]|nr:site-specific DNA-methyltransferase [Spirochaetales bacterium]
MEQLESGSLDLTKMNIEKVKELFPSIVTEGTIDFEMLKILLGGGGDVSREKYQFTWPGKQMSIKIAQTPS